MTLTDFLLARITEDEQSLAAMDGLWDTGNEADFADRVLAECEAKRRIVGWHGVDIQGRCVDDHHYPHPCPTLAFLALPYADHPDCREEWRA